MDDTAFELNELIIMICKVLVYNVYLTGKIEYSLVKTLINLSNTYTLKEKIQTQI